ncbi:hypothetical protein ACVRY0_04185 [Streptococcus intermedius]
MAPIFDQGTALPVVFVPALRICNFTWRKAVAMANYVFGHNPYRLYVYHFLIMEEM